MQFQTMSYIRSTLFLDRGNTLDGNKQNHMASTTNQRKVAHV